MNQRLFNNTYELKLAGPWGKDSGQSFAINVRNEQSECVRVTQYPEIRRCRVGSDCLHENRTALKAVRHEPTPEVGTLARSSDCLPSTAGKGEVQENDGVRCSKPNLDSIVGTQVTIHDPSLFRDQLLLQNHPLIAGCCDQTWPPEDLVKFDHRQCCDFT
jgi:hypothetical protein